MAVPSFLFLYHADNLLKDMKVPNSSLIQFEPGAKDTCLCGSGKIFKKCCKDTYNTDIKNNTSEEFNEGRYGEALRSCRSKITWYTLCHMSHTIPFLESGKPESKILLQIDIEAMGELVNLLHLCYYKTGKDKQFPKALGILSNAISDPRWLNKIIQELALWHLLDNNNGEQAFKELQKIDIRSCTDPETLVLYLDLCPNRISFQERLEIIDRILANTHKESYLLQYTCLKGIAYCLIEEVEDGCNIIESAITRYKSCTADKTSSYGDVRLAGALEMFGMFKNDTEKISEALEIYTNELKSKTYSDSGISMLSMAIAKCHAYLSNFDEAIRYYKVSLDKEDSELVKVFLARAYINSGDLLEGRKLLDSIDASEFDDACNYDLCITWAVLAFTSREKDDIEQATNMMREAKADEPIFIHQRDRLLIDLHDLKPMSDEGFIRKTIKSLNRYILFQPNLFGIGINVNNIVEDVETEKSEDSIGEK